MDDFDIQPTGRLGIDLPPVPSPTRQRRGGINSTPELDKPIIAWDGEGQSLHGKDRAQSLVLFGASTGDPDDVLVSPGLHIEAWRACDLICRVGRKWRRKARHVGYGFDYDGNMIVRTLSPFRLANLQANNECYVDDLDGSARWRIEMIPRKWFQVTDYRRDVTVRIEDIISLHGCSFVRACHDAFGCGADWIATSRGEYEPACGFGCVPDLPEIAAGKKQRGSLVGPWADLDYVRAYWEPEVRMLARLAHKDKKDFWAEGFEVSALYGPAVLARDAMDRFGVRHHLNRTLVSHTSTGRPLPARRLAAPSGGHRFEPEPEATSYGDSVRRGYMAGRFELFQIGRIGHHYSADINSAHPFGLCLAPSLAGAHLSYVREVDKLRTFGLYHIRLAPTPAMFLGALEQQPLFHRDKYHQVTFPPFVQGWFWEREASMLVEWARHQGATDRVEILAGWEIDNIDELARPFADWVPEMYERRQRLKAEKNPNEHGLKLCVNSIWGCTCQVVGWKADKPDKIPAYHQLEWAGHTTSNTRFMLFDAAWDLQPGELISFDTDSFSSTRLPAGLDVGNGLGQWKVSEYRQGYYFQSGLAWLQHLDGTWECKRRGLDADSFTLDRARYYLDSLPALDPSDPAASWPPFQAWESRFTTLGVVYPKNIGQARLYGMGESRHCVWTDKKERLVNVGSDDAGKRQHVHTACPQCDAGIPPAEQAHVLWARTALHPYESIPHTVPWLDLDWGATRTDDGLAPDEV